LRFGPRGAEPGNVLVVGDRVLLCSEWSLTALEPAPRSLERLIAAARTTGDASAALALGTFLARFEDLAGPDRKEQAYNERPPTRCGDRLAEDRQAPPRPRPRPRPRNLRPRRALRPRAYGRAPQEGGRERVRRPRPRGGEALRDREAGRHARGLPGDPRRVP